tara:strand:+ start:1808 stop:1984 length:177 start_codon:yes stop_codon:yes gene_type:complete
MKKFVLLSLLMSTISLVFVGLLSKEIIKVKKNIGEFNEFIRKINDVNPDDFIRFIPRK